MQAGHLDLAELLSPALTTSRAIDDRARCSLPRYFSAPIVSSAMHNEPYPIARAGLASVRAAPDRTRRSSAIQASPAGERPDGRPADIRRNLIPTISMLRPHRPVDAASLLRPPPTVRSRVDITRTNRLHRGLQPSGGLWATCTILTETCGRIDVNISERTATACCTHQVRHALFRAPDQSARPRGVLVSVPAGRSRPHSQDGRGRNHARTTRARDASAGDQPTSPSSLFGVPR